MTTACANYCEPAMPRHVNFRGEGGGGSRYSENPQSIGEINPGISFKAFEQPTPDSIVSNYLLKSCTRLGVSCTYKLIKDGSTIKLINH